MIERVERWVPPDKNDVRLLGMPNIVKPLHMQAPRVFMGATKWEKVRKRCYFDADYKCEICGYESREKADLNAHEIYETDYIKGTSTFIRPVCLCRTCHLLFIHSGRAKTACKHGEPGYSPERLLYGAEHGFKLISEWNKTHEEKIKVFEAMMDYFNLNEISDEFRRLVDKYKIEFYGPTSAIADWGDWRLIYDGKEYKTPYKDINEWEEAMEASRKKNEELDALISGEKMRLSGGTFDEIDTLLNDENP